MKAREHKRKPSVLIAGAGLTGAAAAWLSARAGCETTLVSEARPASQGSALFPGIVRGLGPPESFGRWPRASIEERQAARRREALGFDTLREFLLRTRRDVHFRRTVHRSEAETEAASERLEKCGSALADAGFDVCVESGDGRKAVVRERDATLDRRRLTFELLRAATTHGAELRIPEMLQSLGRLEPEGRVVALSSGPRRFSVVIWAADEPFPGDPAAETYRRRSVLAQLMEAGSERLAAVLQSAGGDVCLSPIPSTDSSRTLLLRLSSEEGDAGTFWPDVPRSWDRFRGRALRQRLLESVVGSHPHRLSARERIVSLTGLARWPVASLLGACREALDELVAN